MKIFVKVKLRAKKEKIEKIDREHFEVSVHASPVEGLANRAVIMVLADYFDIAPSRIVFVSGQKSKQKVFEIAE